MRNVLLFGAIKLNKERKRRKRWQKAASIMAAVVVFCTTYALIMPAITMEKDTLCGMEVHTHTDDCYEQQKLYDLQCVLEAADDVIVIHSHTAACYDAQGALRCELEEVKAHTHTEVCFASEENPCTLDEIQLHVHEEGCWGEENSLLCQLPEVIAHDHSQCLVESEGTEAVLVCQVPEHIHEVSCYPVNIQEDSAGAVYSCGSGEHSHNENCLDEEGNLVCSIPEHIHEAACQVAELDLTADLETARDWETTLENVELSGNWAADILAVASSQLGYRESVRNCILEEGELKGYTRYGQWYGTPYADWDDLFVSFCLHYAEIAEEYMPYEADTARWAERLAALQQYAKAGDYTPAVGDLVFVDADADDTADFVGITAEVLNGAEIRFIAGDTGEGVVSSMVLKLNDDRIIGYGKLPANPLTEEAYGQVKSLREMIAELPAAEDVRTALEALNDEGDKHGYDALRQEIASRIDAIRSAYDGMCAEQQVLIRDLDKLTELEAVCGEGWEAFAALTDDSAALTELTAADAYLIRSADNTTGDTDPENTVRNQDTVCYSFTATAQSYYSDLSFGEARVKVELVLPFGEDQASFDTEAMSWLEEAVLTAETRLINEEEVTCQVLTGFKKLSADGVRGIVVPGTFTETVAVRTQNVAHGEAVYVIISAAMEHSAWDGTCEAHQVQEKLTVVTQILSVYDPQPVEVQQANFEAYSEQITELENRNLSDMEQYFEAQELLWKISGTYSEGGLSDTQLEELAARIEELCNIDLNTVAEPCIGTNWMKLVTGELIDYGTELTTLYSYAEAAVLQTSSAMPADTYSTLFPSSVQIDREGGSEVSDDGAVYVSKTIEGTDIENVFDITLQIITLDEVNEVYQDPDMAVVVVMDISATMLTDFGSITRYQAAMAAGESFLQKFAAQNSVLSRVGYVAFNTSAHEIFDLSVCNTTAQVTSLANTMKTKTGSIINASGYKESSTRFTNMQAGLKMAADMLEEATNQHKYIIFISDGFPTTYLRSGYTGYNPSSSSGTKDTDGVFYDDVLNKWCLYGTSYSDTAAIKARQLAVELKSEGINIFSIGVDVGGQNLWSYHNQSAITTGTNPHSVVERREEASYYNTNGYEIGTMHAEINKTSVTAAEQAAMAQDFKDWLKGSADTGIGSGYYYDSTDLTGLNAAYDTIFQKILELNASSSHLDWVATDPMPDMGVHEVDAMEFIGFWSVDGNLEEKLVGESKDGSQYENTADFQTDTMTIHWDLKNSGYVSTTTDNVTRYMCTLKYRVRLKNEESVFVEGQVYDTNDVTTLTYRIIEVEGEKTTVSERRTISFPIPAVHGYLSELNFQKLQATGNPLEGAEFTLSHDTDNCVFCRGDGESYVTVADQVATSDRYGMVSFTRIPSGHTYTLTETVVPDGFIATKNTYQVVVAYDAQTVTVKDADGNELEWNSTIENDMYYELPKTGSTGTSHLTFGGLLLIAGSLMYICITGCKRRKEER